jgi:hypothetical protein
MGGKSNMTTTAEVLAAVMADPECYDGERRVAAALACGTAEVDGMSKPEVYRAIVSLICAGHVESVAHTHCHTHPRPDGRCPEVEEQLCGMHTLRLGDVETRWQHCYQAEVLSFDEAWNALGMTPRQFTNMLIETGGLIEHPNGGYVAGPHPGVVEREDRR